MNFFEVMKKETGVNLNDVQKEAVLHSEGPLLVLAVPGSGKTTILNMKIGYLLLKKKIPANRIMAVTFSKASAEDMSQRFDRFFSRLTNEKVHFSTIHSFAYQVVREAFQKTGQKYQLIEGDTHDEDWKKNVFNGQSKSLHKKWILRNIFKDMNGEIPTEDEMEEMLTFITFTKNRMIAGRELERIKSSVRQMAEIFQAYEAFKKSFPDKILLDFDDMLTQCHSILTTDQAIREKYQRQFEYILTDESQDNSIVQHLIIEILAKPQNNLCVVADDDQSIFMWRGSDVKKLLQFKKTYPNAKILTMAQNYRSTKDIVETANQFIKQNKNRYEKDMFTDNPAKKPVLVKHLSTYEDQVDYITEEILKSTNRQEIAVLYRNNSSAIPLADKLNRAGILFYMKDMDKKFFNHWVLNDVLNFMRFSYSDKRVDVLEAIHTKFNAYITKRQIQYLKNLPPNESVFDALLKTDLPLYQEKSLPKAKRLFKALNQAKPETAIRMIRTDLGYDRSIKKMSERLGFSAEYLYGILNTLETIAKGCHTLVDFVQRLKDLEKIMKESRFNKRHKDAVTLTTLHGSKGLEFEKVYMIDLVNGIIPSHEDIEMKRNGKHEYMEEAVRLFYVGMTRAKSHLELLSFEKKDKERVTPSVFVKDVKNILQPKKRKLIRSEKLRQQPLISAENLLTANDIVLGRQVYHAKFGLGLIVEVGGNNIGIHFEEVGYKNFLTQFCLQKGLLQKVSSQR